MELMKQEDLEMLLKLSDSEDYLSQWEYGFVEDLMEKQIKAEDNDTEFNLTQAQSDKLTQIHLGI